MMDVAIRCTRDKNRGFTLIELLVCVFIIGVLAALLFPVFKKALQAATLAACAGNLHQLGAAFVMYENDSRGNFPPYATYNPNGPPGTPMPGTDCWNDYLMPYVNNNTNVFICPAAENYAPNNHSYGYNYVNIGSSLGYNSTDPNPPYGPVANILQIAHPEATYLVMDTYWNEARPMVCTPLEVSWNAGGPYAGASGFPDWRRHGGKVNVLFVDGHVEQIIASDPTNLFQYLGQDLVKGDPNNHWDRQ